MIQSFLFTFAARPGIEPRFTASKAAVLPLDDLAKFSSSIITKKRIKIKRLFT